MTFIYPRIEIIRLPTVISDQYSIHLSLAVIKRLFFDRIVLIRLSSLKIFSSD